MATTPEPSPKLALHQLSLYNTGRMTTEQVMTAFVARQAQLERLMAELAAEADGSRPQHHLIVGQRGMGKTMMLARIAAGIRKDEALARRFIPLVFAEEQYAVDRLSKFWLNCLDSLADARELAQDQAAVEKIDATVSALNKSAMRPAKDDQPFAEEVYAAFEGAAQASGQRPVLLVDNLQLVFERLDKRQQHSLRELLMRAGAPVLVGASPSPPPASQDYSAAFYDHFKVHYLKPLSEDEMRELMVRLADAAGLPVVRQRVLDYPQRLKVLRQLTGGNPRTTLTLFFLYAEDFAPRVFGDLENLLDRVTPLYKARFEEQTEQQQVITSAVANHWDPLTTAKLAEVTVLPPATLSAQIDRLEKAGTLERVELFGESRNGYQIAERFFNIWFLMRSASRRQRREVEFLTRFLESFYEPEDRARIARHLMSEKSLSADTYVWRCALEATLTEPETKAALKRHTELLAVRMKAVAEARTRLHELIDFDALPPGTLAFAELREKLMALVPPEAEATPEAFAEAVLGDRQMFMTGEREQLAARPGPLNAEEMAAVLATIQAAKAADVEAYTAEAVAWFSHWLSSGQLRHREDMEDWNRAFKQAQGKAMYQMLVESLPTDFGKHLSEAVITSIRAALRPAEDGSAWQWSNWGYDLQYQLSCHTEAESAYREALARDPKDAMTWNNLGNLLQEPLQRYEEAENAYREAIACDPKDAMPWNNLGNLLREHFQRYEEAASAYRKAIACDPKDAMPWNNLGNLLQEHLQRIEEAESAYREAIARDPKYAIPWNNLGVLLHDHLQRYAEAESAYREAIARDPKYANPWNNLGNLLCEPLQRYEEAESAYREAIARAPQNASPWNNLGNVLCEHLQRYAEAESAYREAIARDPKYAKPWYNLGNLLCEHLQRYEEAESAYREAIAHDPKNASPWNNLGNLLCEHLQRYEEAESAYREAIAHDPKNAIPWNNLGNLLHQHLQRYEEAESVYREAIARDPKNASPWNRLGNLNCDCFGRFEDAAASFEHALTLVPDSESALNNRLFLRRDFLGEGAETRPLLMELLAFKLPEYPDSAHLHTALFAAYDENWGVAREALVKAIELRREGFVSTTTEDWLRASAVLIHLNYGEALIKFLEGLGDTVARLRPWVEAVRAAQIGDKRALQNIAPEIRTLAEVFYDGIELRLKKLPEKTRRRKLPPPKAGRQRKR